MKTFFIAEELDQSVVEKMDSSKTTLSTEMEAFEASWEDDQSKPTLSKISLQTPKGDLLAVVGKVGSGKSSLLSALLGEMGKLRGRIGVTGQLAYVPQQAWIQNATVRENILFGRAYNRQLYKKVRWQRDRHRETRR